MLDIQELRKNLPEVVAGLRRRHFEFDQEAFLNLEGKKKEFQTRSQSLQERRNAASKQIGAIKKNKGDASELMAEMAQVGKELDEIRGKLADVSEQLDALLARVPNIPDKSVPDGRDERDNVELRKWGEPRRFDFEPKDHVDLGAKLGLDMEMGAALGGARFAFMKSDVSRLHRSLAQFMLDLHTEKHGYCECSTPYIVNPEILFGTGQLPKFEEDMYKVLCGGEENVKTQYLISTAEITLTNVARDRIFAASDLPLKLTAHTPCFRSEAGSYGKDTRGMIRQHQFDKVEMVRIVKPEDSWAALEELTANAEETLQLLGLPYRVIVLCAGDMGFSSAKTYDIEVWLPSQNMYREISSCSNCLDFQARRLKARFKDADGKNKFAHTLNGSGVAVGRALVAVMENYQQEDGSITVPEVLRPYMKKDRIEPMKNPALFG